MLFPVFLTAGIRLCVYIEIKYMLIKTEDASLDQISSEKTKLGSDLNVAYSLAEIFHQLNKCI